MGTLPFAMMPPPPLAKRLTANVDDFTLHADTPPRTFEVTAVEPRSCRRSAKS